GRGARVGEHPAAARVQGRARERGGRDPHRRERAGDAVRTVVPCRVDLLRRGHQRRRQRAAAARPARPAPRPRGDLPLGGRRPRRNAVRAGLVVAGAVALALGYPPFHFPLLGLVAVAPAVLVQWADLAGARGVTLWVAWVNVMIVEAMIGERGEGSGSMRWRPVLAVLASVALAWGYGTWRMRTLPVRDVGVVGLVQPNEGYREKWDSLRQDSVFGRLLGLSERLRSAARLDLLIWPEAAVPGYFIDHPEWDAAVARRARETGTPILTGGLDAAFHDDRSYD